MSSPKVLFGFHAVGVRLKTAPQSIIEIYYEPTRRDARMRQLIERVQAVVDVPLCIDSSVPGALEEGLKAANGRPLLNSVTGEEDRLELVLPLVKKYNVPVVAISNDDTGICNSCDCPLDFIHYFSYLREGGVSCWSKNELRIIRYN